MKVRFRTSFERDLKRLRKDRQILDRIRGAIEAVEEAGDLRDVPGIKSLTNLAADCYRLRVGDYRIGLVTEGEAVVFVRCLHRRSIYRHFP